MVRYAAEFIGTFFWVLTVILTVNNPDVGNIAPLAIGLVVAALIFAGAKVSGAHYNPALTLALWMRGHLDRTDAIYYMVSQIVAGIVAALIGSYLLTCQGITDINPRSNGPLCALTGEFIGTFLLGYAIINTIAVRSHVGSVSHALSGSFALTAGGYGFSALSGAVFNPAVAVGLCTTGMASWGDGWLYFIGPLLGSAAAASVVTASENATQIP